mmetsp:Transcript_28070/g.97119  ORF Transcript_28070/g.97119 Transcript_28070/m.97119 type:complete len:221 (+) Transcript_28070:2053-2715(+)
MPTCTESLWMKCPTMSTRPLPASSRLRTVRIAIEMLIVDPKTGVGTDASASVSGGSSPRRRRSARMSSRHCHIASRVSARRRSFGDHGAALRPLTVATEYRPSGWSAGYAGGTDGAGPKRSSRMAAIVPFSSCTGVGGTSMLPTFSPSPVTSRLRATVSIAMGEFGPSGSSASTVVFITTTTLVSSRISILSSCTNMPSTSWLALPCSVSVNTKAEMAER